MCDNINVIRINMITDKEKAGWLMMTMDITAQDLFERNYDELKPTLQAEVLVAMIENRDFKGL